MVGKPIKTQWKTYLTSSIRNEQTLFAGTSHLLSHLLASSKRDTLPWRRATRERTDLGESDGYLCWNRVCLWKDSDYPLSSNSTSLPIYGLLGIQRFSDETVNLSTGGCVCVSTVTRVFGYTYLHSITYTLLRLN
jgi:hypothetical protein